ncbi:uncharacterized protein LOC117241156 isoform X2 [Bombus vosnesenskii]|uniref:Uncharacterized protein LOC117241156 isoform X2 n=1 Tax=Bombus vosnesenskii TaxID=207650 RepID=A0A6J3LGR1_9HYME|nr:uncharacterized protein LOC117241156 isoform X2 [Bombus vosnesenskii]
MMLYYIALAIICMCDEFFNMAARVSLWYGVGLMSTILLFRCCVTYLDRSHNIIRFFDMPWLLTTAAFYYGCLPSWLLYMVFRKQGAITYFARKPSRMMITCSQGVHYLYYSTNSVTPPFDLSTI